MEALASLIVVGILSSVFIFGLKTGIGCGFSKVKWPVVFGLCILYFIIAVVAGYFMDAIDVASFMSSPLASAIHITLALFMVFGGIYTMKKWNAGCDVSKKTFLILVFPCPVCMAALLVSCVALSTVVTIDGVLIGAIVGIVFAVSIILSTLFMRNLGKITQLVGFQFSGTPDTLGSVMVFIGVFYLTAAIMIPAYIAAGSPDSAPAVPFTSVEFTSLFLTLLIIIFGAVLTRMADGGTPKKKTPLTPENKTNPK
ncbi:DUF2162 domain-containing protein [Methanolapillus ohkumae]|uniref:DUF2162 domain-containing protein n=1 Tax=Methanolapillus ohkumae TaxID=3028298 RepID=A0AA96V501_9EURY|nr:hypothetical protein MsAm2_03660 [Methanosarcinaceae archaeon Am2]